VRRPLRWLLVLPAIALLTPAPVSAASTSTSIVATSSPDYPSGASWVPASPTNYTVADRPHDYPINMIVIHDIEGDAPSAIRVFQTPYYGGSAHYVVNYNGSITQMVREKDIAWHAGNWDYNTRAIGIEHAGYACCSYYTRDEYQASAQLAASICSRYGVPMDRAHVIGHSEVPDPNNRGLFGGEDHHTDPGPYWNWGYYMYYAQIYAGRLPSPPHMMTRPSVVDIDGGATISWVGQTCHLPVASYTVTVQPGNIVRNLPGTATSTTVTGLQNGATYTVTVTATNADGTDSNSTSFIPSPPCAMPALSAQPASPGPTGGAITFTGATSTCTNPNYRFWIRPPGGAWQIVQDYGTANTFTWTGTAYAGAYAAEVDVRQQTSDVVYDSVRNIAYTLNGCTAAHLAADSLSPQMPGITINLGATASCPGTAQYRFWIRPPGGSWRIVQDYSPTATYSWATTGLAKGTYGLEVDVRDAGSAAVYEVVANITYSLGPPTCHNPSLTATPVSSAATGSTVTFSSSTAGCPNPRYRFWVQPPGGAWYVAQNYSASNTFNWNASGAPGTYRIEVDVRDANSTASYDAVNWLSYALAGCTAAHLTTDKTSPQLTGTASVTLTGTPTCPATADYRFWIRPPGGSWTVVQNYSSSANYTWNTASLAPGTYSLEVDVRDHGSTSSYEAVYNATFMLSPCVNATMIPDKASPQAAGTTVTFTASASCTGTAQYRFWVKAPGGGWTIAQDYGASNMFVWNTAGKPAGTYSLEVDVRNAGSTASYQAVANVTYTLGP
jgi:N-acetyl-anhydromuramyl-L-alanine amidase AmpD